MFVRVLAAAVLAAVVTVSSAAQQVTSLMFQVEPKTEDCIHEDLKAGSTVDAQVLVTRGGKLDVRFRIENPYKAVLFEQLLFSNIDDRTGQVLSTIVKKGHNFVAQVDGTYSFCFDNKMSRWTAKVLDFDLSVSGKSVNSPASGHKDEAGKPAEVSTMLSTVNKLKGKLGDISDMQRYHRQREFTHRDTQEVNCARVAWFTVIECLVCVTFSLGQLFMVRSWFSSASRLPSSV